MLGKLWRRLRGNKGGFEVTEMKYPSNKIVKTGWKTEEENKKWSEKVKVITKPKRGRPLGSKNKKVKTPKVVVMKKTPEWTEDWSNDLL